MSLHEAHSYLNSFINFEPQLHQAQSENFDLGRVRKLLDLMGSPGRDLRIIHVAGTKGKGSTCIFLAGILQEAGFRVGLYTSPHLHKVNERIRVLTSKNRHSHDAFAGSISDDELAAAIAVLRPQAASVQNTGDTLTYFEILTAAALQHFKAIGVDFVILETGLGGRLDATNAVDSMIALITPVSFDHMNILGGTLAQIAYEKAGIIKNTHQKVVIAPQDKEVMDVVLGRCREFGIEPVRVCPDKYEDLRPSLKGKHQISNAATALETIKLLRSMGFKISDDAIEEGLKHVRWSGRFELLQEHPMVIVDCAHNAASAKALARTVVDVYPYRRVILVLGVSQDKDVAAICLQLKDSAAHIILTKANHPRAYTFHDIEASGFLGGKPFEIIQDLPQALDKALQLAGQEDVVLVTGSVFIVSQSMSLVLDRFHRSQSN